MLAAKTNMPKIATGLAAFNAPFGAFSFKSSHQ
jgi:hypothetical protein